MDQRFLTAVELPGQELGVVRDRGGGPDNIGRARLDEDVPTPLHGWSKPRAFALRDPRCEQGIAIGKTHEAIEARPPESVVQPRHRPQYAEAVGPRREGIQA